MFLCFVKFGEYTSDDKFLKIVIPEDLDYTNVFDDIFKNYFINYELVQTKTTNMGSLFELMYNVVLKKNINEKELIDKIRCRNGNLKIILSHPLTGHEL